MPIKQIILTLFVFYIFQGIKAQNQPARIVAGIPVNYSEDSVGSYSLPKLLVSKTGKKISTSEEWNKIRRPEIFTMYEEYQFGKMPSAPKNIQSKITEDYTTTLNGKAIRRQVTVFLTDDKTHKMDLLIYLPLKNTKPSPLLLHISFTANCNMVNDPAVPQTEIWNREGKKVPASTSTFATKLNVEKFIDEGFGIATVYYGDIEPDFKEGINYGIRGVYIKKGESNPAPNEWGAISAWAWGLSRAMDYFETDKKIDSKKIALFGVSRLGKTVLWTGAHDTRFAMVIANCSGEGGAALSRRNYGETIAHLSHPTRYEYQFAKNYQSFGDRVSEFPIDAHMLISLIAPRPLLLETGDTDYWSDPKGEFEAAIAATPVYHLFNKKGMEDKKMPPAGTPVLNTLGYSMHSGGHGTVSLDWDIAIEFMKKYL